MSESFERENRSLQELLQLDDYEIISMVKRRELKGGNPAILINKQKYWIKRICPDLVSVPVGVEAIWVIVGTSVWRSSGRRSGVAIQAVDCWQ